MVSSNQPDKKYSPDAVSRAIVRLSTQEPEKIPLETVKSMLTGVGLEVPDDLETILGKESLEQTLEQAALAIPELVAYRNSNYSTLAKMIGYMALDRFTKGQHIWVQQEIREIQKMRQKAKDGRNPSTLKSGDVIFFEDPDAYGYGVGVVRSLEGNLIYFTSTSDTYTTKYKIGRQDLIAKARIVTEHPLSREDLKRIVLGTPVYVENAGRGLDGDSMARVGFFESLRNDKFTLSENRTDLLRPLHGLWQAINRTPRKPDTMELSYTNDMRIYLCQV